MRDLRKARAEKYRRKFIKSGITDPKELRKLLKAQEEKDFHDMGYSNKKYMNEMLRGSRPISDDVAQFYAKKTSVPKEWILYGSLSEHIYYVMNQLPHTFSKEDCLRIEIEAAIQGISYGQLSDFFEIAQHLGIIEKFTPFMNIVHLYDEGDKGQSYLLLLYHIYGKSHPQKYPQALLNQLIKVLNSRQMFLSTEESIFLYFVNEIVRELPEESQNLVALASGIREVLTRLDGEFSLADSLTKAEACQLLPKLNKVSLLAKKEKQEDLEHIVNEFGDEALPEKVQAYSQKIMQVITTFEDLTRKQTTLEDFKNQAKKHLSAEKLRQAFDFKRNMRDEVFRKQSEEILEELLEIIRENQHFTALPA